MQKAFSALEELLCLGLALLLSSVAAVAQFNASVTGKVIDPSGALVPRAKISVKNSETNRVQSAITGDSGVYRISQLPPGTYTVEAEANGFRKATIGPVVVLAEQPLAVDFRLEPGEITQTVTVTAGPIAIQTEDASVGSTVDQQQIRELPQFGRDPLELLRLTPGVLGDAARSGAGAAIALPNTTGPGGSNTSIFQTENQ